MQLISCNYLKYIYIFFDSLFCSEIIELLLATRGDLKSSDIGVVTPYRGQVLTMIDELKRRLDFYADLDLMEVKVGSVNEFQVR
jgi:superfamily I DNA and/or RNA helicase